MKVYMSSSRASTVSSACSVGGTGRLRPRLRRSRATIYRDRLQASSKLEARPQPYEAVGSGSDVFCCPSFACRYFPGRELWSPPPWHTAIMRWAQKCFLANHCLVSRPRSGCASLRIHPQQCQHLRRLSTVTGVGRRGADGLGCYTALASPRTAVAAAA